MVIERFKNRDAEAVYRRFRERGRMLPDGLRYIAIWVESNQERCFQLMESDDLCLLDEWIAHWQDLVEFEVIPVVSSGETAKTITQML